MNMMIIVEMVFFEMGGILFIFVYWGEMLEELMGFVKVMWVCVFIVDGFFDVVDICGIGGDGIFIFNILMVLVIVVLVVGVKIVKYGNCFVFFKSGSVDVLEVLEVLI